MYEDTLWILCANCRKWHLGEPRFAKFSGGMLSEPPYTHRDSRPRAEGVHVSSFQANKNLPIFPQKGLEYLLL